MTKLQNAYDTIIGPEKRRAYDLRWPSIRDNKRAQQESEKRQAEDAQAERKRAAEARVRKQHDDNEREERLRILEQSRRRYDDDIFELSRVIRKLEADLKRLRDQDDEDIRKEKQRNGWWASLSSTIYGQVKETEKQKQERDIKRLHRNASKTVKGSELAEKKARHQKLQDALQDVNGRIAAEKKTAEDEKKRADEAARARKQKMEQEAQIRKMREAREHRAKEQKEQEERAAKEAREAQAEWDAWQAQLRARSAAAEAERRRQEAENRAEAVRRAEEAAAAEKARKARNARSGRATKSTCRHDGWWPKVEGKQLCGECDAFQNRFVLQCPGCKMLACASCQKSIRGGRWKSGGAGGASRRHGSVGHERYDPDDGFSYDYWD